MVYPPLHLAQDLLQRLPRRQHLRSRCEKRSERLARTLTECLDMNLDTVMDRVVTSVIGVFKAQAAFISLAEPAGVLYCVAFAGSLLNEFQRGYRSPPGVGMAGRAVAER